MKHVRLHSLKPAHLYTLLHLHWRTGSPRLQAQRVHEPEAILQTQPWPTWHGPCATEAAALPAGGALASSASARAGTRAGPTCSAGAVGIHG